jgi:hypothetical protein
MLTYLFHGLDRVRAMETGANYKHKIGIRGQEDEGEGLRWMKRGSGDCEG